MSFRGLRNIEAFAGCWSSFAICRVRRSLISCCCALMRVGCSKLSPSRPVGDLMWELTLGCSWRNEFSPNFTSDSLVTELEPCGSAAQKQCFFWQSSTRTRNHVWSFLAKEDYKFVPKIGGHWKKCFIIWRSCRFLPVAWIRQCSLNIPHHVLLSVSYWLPGP